MRKIHKSRNEDFWDLVGYPTNMQRFFEKEEHDMLFDEDLQWGVNQ